MSHLYSGDMSLGKQFRTREEIIAAATRKECMERRSKYTHIERRRHLHSIVARYPFVFKGSSCVLEEIYIYDGLIADVLTRMVGINIINLV